MESGRMAAEAGSLAMVIAAWVVAFREYPSLPAQFPTHFGFTGRPDAWGTRRMVWFYPLLMTALYLVNGWTAELVAHAPRHPGMPVGLTWLNFEMQAMFLYLEVRSVAVARGRAAGLGITFMPIMLVAIVVTSLLLTRG